MVVNQVKISRAFLESGRNLRLSDRIVVKHPSLEEILELGNGVCCETVYWSHVFTLLCDPYLDMVLLDDLGLDYENVTPFELFVIRWNQCLEDYQQNQASYDSLHYHPLDAIKQALRFFLGEHDFDFAAREDGATVLVDRKYPEVYQIDRQIFQIIGAFLQMCNGLVFSDRIHPANENAKQVLIEDMRAQQKKAPKKRDSGTDADDLLGQKIAAVIHAGTGGITPFNFTQLKIYQLMDAYETQHKKDHYNQLMSAVYHGTLSWEHVNQNELDWAR